MGRFQSLANGLHLRVSGEVSSLSLRTCPELGAGDRMMGAPPPNSPQSAPRLNKGPRPRQQVLEEEKEEWAARAQGRGRRQWREVPGVTLGKGSSDLAWDTQEGTELQAALTSGVTEPLASELLA